MPVVLLVLPLISQWHLLCDGFFVSFGALILESLYKQLSSRVPLSLGGDFFALLPNPGSIFDMISDLCCVLVRPASETHWVCDFRPDLDQSHMAVFEEAEIAPSTKVLEVMDGLLAWAADVVGGGSDPESPAARAFLAFTPDQLHEIERLDRRASELQRSLQQLRHRLPPANIAQGLPHLHAESLASQSALALELHAHSASRIQAQELDQLEQKLREEYDCLEKELRAQRDSIEELEEKVQEASPLEEEEASELQSLRAELAKWQTKAAESRKELSMVENEALAWPSSGSEFWITWLSRAYGCQAAQREKDLERRLRSLTEQLTAKQAQAEKLTIERDNLEARVEHANQARKNQLVESLAHTVKRNKIGVKHLLMDPSEPQRKYPSRGGLSSSLGVFRTSLAFKALVEMARTKQMIRRKYYDDEDDDEYSFRAQCQSRRSNTEEIEKRLSRKLDETKKFVQLGSISVESSRRTTIEDTLCNSRVLYEGLLRVIVGEHVKEWSVEDVLPLMKILRVLWFLQSMKALCVVEGNRIGDQSCYKEADFSHAKRKHRDGTWSFFDSKVKEVDDDGKTLPREPPFLPPPRTSKPVLVLDLDNTLVSCLLDHHGSDPGGKVCSYFVAKRPGVDEFLHTMAKHYEIVLWTGSRKRYADGVLEVLPDVFSHRLYRVDKKLANLGRDLRKVVMVDDCRRGGCPETDNLIVISHYVHDGRHEACSKLKEVGEILVKMSWVEDVRDEMRKLRESGVLQKIAACPHACKVRG
ncbi:hypothetical protein SELMODRAFT_442163 [Selaginella moellendorffii]|uniref:FCP1 homology domain-containing protein n=2 Tax=Selaginella moellendorffii TaxID=88036 RepID=D8RRA7_SELML|nr:hypothetical protein SELMODRAFT_442163 [Selaginella moellendorffii]